MIPLERNPNIQLFVNAHTAAALGPEVPASPLLRADEVFE